MFITSPSTLRPLTRLSTVVCPISTSLSSASGTGQTQRSRRWHSTTTVEPPPAGGHLTSVASSQLLRFTRETALRTPGLTWSDEDNSGSVRSIVGGRETSKMNMCQAVRDALRYSEWASLSGMCIDGLAALHLQKKTPLLSLERTSRLGVYSAAPWYDSYLFHMSFSSYSSSVGPCRRIR